jgi:hypothetical protein
MLLIDVCKLVQVEATSAGGLIIIRKDFPNGFQVIQGPIKVKLDTDILLVISPAQDASGNPKLKAEILKSTARKFQSDYVREVFSSKLVASNSRTMRFAELEVTPS